MLCKLIKEETEQNPFKFDGFDWAARPQPVWAKKIGVDTRTIRRLMAEEPIVAVCILVEEKKTLLLRLGENNLKSSRHLANTMAKIFRNKFEREISRRDYGCLIGLAECWPEGHQVAIFKSIIFDWVGFVCAVKQHPGETLGRFYEFPSITVIRRFQEVGPEFYEMILQESGHLVPKTDKIIDYIKNHPYNPKLSD